MISQLFAMYQFGGIDTADTTDGKVTNVALLSAESDKVHRLYQRISLGVLVLHAPRWWRHQFTIIDHSPMV